MADQRRYQYVDVDPPEGYSSWEEFNRFKASGEKPWSSDDWWANAKRAGKDVLTAIPEDIAQTTMLPEMAWAAGKWIVKRRAGQDPSFYNELYGEDAGAVKEQLRAQMMEQKLSRLPPEARNNQQILDQLDAEIAGSKEMYDFDTEASSAWGKNVRRYIEQGRTSMGMQQPWQDTTADELLSLGGSVIMPLGKLKAAKTLGGKLLQGAAEVFLPGHHSAVGAVMDAGTGAVVNQGVRALGGMPNVATDPANAFRTEPTDPFRAVPTTPGYDKTGRLPQQVNPVKPTFGVEDMAMPPVTQLDPVDAETQQLSGIEMSGTKEADIGLWGSLIAAAAIAAAVWSGKTPRARPNVQNNVPQYPPVTPPVPPSRTGPTPTTGAPPVVQETLTRTQKGVAAAHNKRQPVIDKVKEATQHLPPDQRDAAIRGMERKLHGGSLQEKGSAFRSAHDFGNLPGLHMPAQATVRQLKDLYSGLSEQQVKMWTDVHAARTYSKMQVLETKSIQDQLDAAQRNYNLATNPAERQRLAGEMQSLRGDITRRQNGVENLASGMTRRDYRTLEQAVAADPQLRDLDNMYRRIHGDIDQSQVNLRQYTDVEVLRNRQMYDYAMELMNDDYADSKWWERGIDKVARTLKGRTDMFRTARGAESRIGRGVGRIVKKPNPLGPVEYTERRLRDHISYTRDNEAIKEFMQQMQGSSEWGRSLSRAHPSMTLTEFNKRPPNIANDPNVFAYSDGGMIHFVRSGDQALIRGLRNAPADIAGIFELTKRIWSTFTTGIGMPAFAPVSALNDMVGRYTKKGGRLGYIHGGLDRVFPNVGAVQKLLDNVVDPTAVAKIAVRALKDVNAPLLRVFGEKVAKDLTDRSTIIGRMAQLPGGQQLLDKAGRHALLTYRNSMHLLGIKHGILGQPPIDASFENWSRGLGNIPNIIPPGKTSKVVNGFIDGWTHINDAIKTSTKMAAFAQEMERLNRQYNGNIPKSKMIDLEYDIKTFAGDMSVSPGDETIAKAINSVPFGLNIVNSTAQFALALRHNPTMAMKLTSGIVIPWAGMVAYISHPELNGNPELTRWYYDELPAWQRQTSMPLPTTGYLTRAAMAIAEGQPPPMMTPDDVYLYKVFPEVAPYMATGLSVARNLGLFGSYAERTQNPLAETYEIAKATFIPPTSPVFSLLSEATQGKDPQQAKSLDDPWMTEETRDLFKAIFSTGADIMYETGTAAVGAYKHDGLAAAFEKGAKYLAYGVEKRLPTVIGENTSLFGTGKRRLYASTEQRQRVLNAYDTVQPLYDKLGKDKRASRSDFPEEVLRDPKAVAMARTIRASMYSGMMNVLRKSRSDITHNIEGLDRDRGKFEPRQYDKLMRKYHDQMTDINDQQEKIIRNLDFQLFQAYGTDIEGAVQYASQFVD